MCDKKSLASFRETGQQRWNVWEEQQDYKTNAQIAKELKLYRIWTNYLNTREAGYKM